MRALHVAERLADEHGVSAEVVDLRSLRPLDVETVAASVAKTNRAVCVEEGWPTLRRHRRAGRAHPEGLLRRPRRAGRARRHGRGAAALRQEPRAGGACPTRTASRPPCAPPPAARPERAPLAWAPSRLPGSSQGRRRHCRPWTRPPRPSACSSSTTSPTSSTSSRWRCASRASPSRPPARAPTRSPRSRAFRPHLMVLDVMLPDMEGFDVARRLGAQRADVPIIFLTARDATEDKVRGLTTGGDDYVTKPFSLEELVARIRTILRRTGAAEPESGRLVFEDLELDEDTHEVARAGDADRADRDRVPAAALPDAQPAPRAHARAAARPRVGLRLRRRRARARDLHQLPAQEARRPRPVADPHRARRRATRCARRAADAPRCARAWSPGCSSSRRSGCSLLAAITYAEQRSFLSTASTRRSQRALGLVSERLPAGNAGVAGPRRRRRRAAAGGGGPAAGRGQANLPSGTYGERRDADGHGASALRCRSATARRRPPPALPATCRRRAPVHARRPATARATACSSRRARRRHRQHGRRACRCARSTRRCGRLLLVEALVIARRAARARPALAYVRRAPRPAPAGPHRRDRRARSPAATSSRRVEPADAAHRGRAARAGAQRDARPARGARSPSARPARTGCAASWPTRRTSCARRCRRSAATPSCSASARAQRARRRRQGDAAHRGGGGADGHARRGPADAGAARRGPRRRPRERVDLGRRRAATRSTTRGRRRPDRAIDARRAPATAVVAGDPHQLRQVLGNLLRNALVHTPAGTPIEVAVARDRRRGARSTCATTARAADRRRRRALRALLARRGAAASAAAAAPGSGSRSSPGSSRPTAAA